MLPGLFIHSSFHSYCSLLFIENRIFLDERIFIEDRMFVEEHVFIEFLLLLFRAFDQQKLSIYLTLMCFSVIFRVVGTIFL